MTNKQGMGKRKPDLGNQRNPGVLPDMEWLRKRRDDVPVINRAAPRKTPLLDLLKPVNSEQPPKPTDSSGDDGTEKVD